MADSHKRIGIKKMELMSNWENKEKSECLLSRKMPLGIWMRVVLTDCKAQDLFWEDLGWSAFEFVYNLELHWAQRFETDGPPGQADQ